MNPRKLSADEQKSLIKTLNNYFPNETQKENKSEQIPPSTIAWENAAPLLAMLATDREIAKKLKENYQLIVEPTNIIKNLNTLCDRFAKKGILQEGKITNPYFYRLPIIIGEYSRHTKIINNAINEFNQLIENYHQKSTTDLNIDGVKLNYCFLNIVSRIAEHGPHCFTHSLTDLINMLHGYSCIDIDLEQDQKKPIISEKKESPALSLKVKNASIGATPEIKQSNKEQSTQAINKKKSSIPIRIIAAKDKNIPGSLTPFIEQSIYAINRAGRLTSESSKLVVNGFGLKFGGHFDGLLTHTPTLIHVGDFYSILWRELSQRMELPAEDSDDAIKFRVVLLTTLKALGMVIDSTTDTSDPSDYYISPFSTQPQAFMTRNSIKKMLSESAETQQFKLSNDNLLMLSDYLSQVIYRMQFNISESLGIGANDDDTVSFSNDGRDYIFQFNQNESEWGSRFAHVSLHRQGPAQPHMNATKGAQHELAAAFITEFERMSQLQRSEYEETVYNAIVDNLVTDLFPHPDFFENSKYKKYRKQYVLTKDEAKQTQLSSYIDECMVGIFKENGQTTPRFRRAGTIDIHPLPKDHPESLEASKSFNSRNPLAAKQFQYAQAMQGGTRGDTIYNPIGPDGFISDIFNGQVIKFSDGSFLPFIGVIPKNFDKEFELPTELCASFVIRMLHSSRLMSYCPTFCLNYNLLKSYFLPKKEMIPDLPPILNDSSFLQTKMLALKESLDKKPDDLSFYDSEKALTSLFKNIVYLLRQPGIKDEVFSISYHHLIKDPHFLKEISRDHFEKVIRILKINAPVRDIAANKEFMAKVIYLEKLIQAFYPEPSIETAQKIKHLAKTYEKPLTKHADVQDYFKILHRNQQINLSRQQSPGMIFMKLRGDVTREKRTLARMRADFDRMHYKSFLAGYRDPEGGLVTKPNNSDQLLDLAAKGIAKFSVGMQHDSNPLGQVITAPFVGAYESAKNSYHNNDSAMAKTCFVPLRFVGGLLGGTTESGIKVVSYGLKFIARPGVRAKDAVIYCTSQIDTSTTKGKVAIAGLFIPALFGFVVGTVESIGKLLYDCTLSPIDDFLKHATKLQKDEKSPPINEHPLYIQATPDNKPGFKVKMSNLTRDTLLEPVTRSLLIKKLRMLVKEIISTAYPNFTSKEKEIAAVQLISESVLTEKQWEQFYEYFDSHSELESFLNKHKDTINSQIISAAYRCFLERSSNKARFDMIKQMCTLYKLLPEQTRTLKDLIKLYNNHPTEQENYILLFSENGEIRNKLEAIDYYSQKLHDAVMQSFDAEKVKCALYEGNKDSPTTPCYMTLTQDAIQKLPSKVLEKLKQPDELAAQKLKIRDELKIAYQAIEELKNEMKELQTDTSSDENDIAEIKTDIEKLNTLIRKYAAQAFLQNVDSPNLSIPNSTDVQKTEALLSKKDKAHLKWKLFATRELTHEFLPNHEFNAVFEVIENIPVLQKYDLIKLKIECFKTCSILLMQLCNIENLDAFYEAYHQLKMAIESTVKPEKYPRNLLQILEDYFNVAMNTALNKTLDVIDGKQTKNPLNQSKVIGSWLMTAFQRKDDFNSLLSQQLDQPFVHLAILRQAYIIHALETTMKITKIDERIRKTGLQKLLRIHYLESNVVKRNGVLHYESRHINNFETYLKVHGIEESPTFHYADSRVKTKLGLFDRSNPFNKRMTFFLDTDPQSNIRTKGA